MKYEKVSETTYALFEERFLKTSLNQVINFAVLHNPKTKMSPLGLCGKINKTHEIIKSALEADYSGTPDFTFIINEDIFSLLDTPHQFMVIDKLFAQIGYDYDKDQPLIIQPDVQEFSGILKKYSYEELEALKLQVESFYQNKSEEESDKPKGKRGRPRKN